uniref:Uncharacterized protein n=1 Tax=Klebsiella pneumoniae TaxID=573 RepID=A0A8B0SQ71_KLEPN|nr:hypothetical protein [Klebsiella pneumoniae]
MPASAFSPCARKPRQGTSCCISCIASGSAVPSLLARPLQMQGFAGAAILARSQFFYEARRSSRRFSRSGFALKTVQTSFVLLSALRPPVSPLASSAFRRAVVSARHNPVPQSYEPVEVAMYHARQTMLNVEESDRLSFLPDLFGNDFSGRRDAGLCAR